jgi:hypothetical protein
MCICRLLDDVTLQAGVKEDNRGPCGQMDATSAVFVLLFLLLLAFWQSYNIQALHDLVFLFSW